MNESQLIARAEKFLKSKNIAFIKSGEIGRRNGERVEIIFIVPKALDPNIVVDPPDVRVWVNVNSGEVKFIPQM